MSDYKSLKESKQWSTWYHATVATAIAHGLQNILDSNYVPQPGNDKDLFDPWQCFFFSVLTTCVHTPDGVLLVQQHSDPKDVAKFGNAQSLFAALVQKSQTGIHALLTAAQLEKEINSFVLNESWTQGISHFLTTFSHRLMDLDNLRDVPTDDHWKSDRLKSALLPHKAMSAFVSGLESNMTAIALQTNTPVQPMSYQNLFESCVNHASKLDDQRRQQRAV